MFVLWVILTLMSALLNATGTFVCYKEVGCFSMDPPWHSSLRLLPPPRSPAEIETRLYLYTPIDPNFRTDNLTYYNKLLPVVIITHGYLSHGDHQWLNRLKNAYLKNVPANVFICDWGRGAHDISYLQVASNTRIVAKIISMFIEYLRLTQNLQPEFVHLIGHSLGAHVMGYVGKLIPGIGRITGLDPAQPTFDGFTREVRLDSTDAKFVDVIHTNGRLFGFGMISAIGHVDFYINGGAQQPGCGLIQWKSLQKAWGGQNSIDLPTVSTSLSCSHSRAYEYFIETLESDCIMWGRKATIETIAKAENFAFSIDVTPDEPCTFLNCTPLGLSTPNYFLRGPVIVYTNEKYPYCRAETLSAVTGSQSEEDETDSIR